MSKAAIFWDRDNTLIRDPGYLSDPEQVELLPGAAEAVRRLGEAGFENIIVTNQSGVARGLVDEPTVERIHARLRERLAAAGADIDAVYYCPYLDGSEAVVEAYRQDSDLRKPKPGMLLKAAVERDIDLQASWSIGDSVRDAEAGRAAGCRTILIAVQDQSAADRAEQGAATSKAAGTSAKGKRGSKRSGAQPAPSSQSPGASAGAPAGNWQLESGGGGKSVDFVAGSLAEAVDIVLRHRPNSATAAVRDDAGGLEAAAGVTDPLRSDGSIGAEVSAGGMAPRAGAGGGMETGPGAGAAREPERPVAGDSMPVLQEILALLRVMDRRARTEEFTMAGLAAAIVQVVALAALVWALFGYLWNEPLGVQLVRLGFAMLLQLLALTFFVLGSRK